MYPAGKLPFSPLGFIGLLIYLRLNLVTLLLHLSALLLHLSWSGYSSHSLSRALLLSYINPEAKEESPDLRSNLLTQEQAPDPTASPLIYR